MNRNNAFQKFSSLFRRRPSAMAFISGSTAFPAITGTVRFYQSNLGVISVAEITGLPDYREWCKSPVFGFHIHEGNECAGDLQDQFSKTRGHYNPYNCAHPYHAGDMPPLFSAGGYAFSVFLTDRFTVDKIIGKTVVIHASADDFHTQPSGASGEKIGCGVIQKQAF